MASLIPPCFQIKQLLEDQRVPPTCRNQQGVSPIHMACQAGQRDLAEMLVDMGADLQCKDNSGNTCLHFAAKGASLELVQVRSSFLITASYDVGD
jgi:ankyrin repeat protein